MSTWDEIVDQWDSPSWKDAARNYHGDREPVKVQAPKPVPLNGKSHEPTSRAILLPEANCASAVD